MDFDFDLPSLLGSIPDDVTPTTIDGPTIDGPTTDDIVDAARNQMDSNAYQLYNYNDGIPSGEAKDHQFVANTLYNAGLGFDGDISKHPSIADWADPNTDIPGWSVVDGPAQAGDVLANSKPIATHWYMSPGQSMGIATGDDTSIGVLDNNRVAESTFGFEDGHEPTIRRSDAVQMAQNMGCNTPDTSRGPILDGPKPPIPDKPCFDENGKLITPNPPGLKAPEPLPGPTPEAPNGEVHGQGAAGKTGSNNTVTGGGGATIFPTQGISAGVDVQKSTSGLTITGQGQYQLPDGSSFYGSATTNPIKPPVWKAGIDQGENGCHVGIGSSSGAMPDSIEAGCKFKF